MVAEITLPEFVIARADGKRWTLTADRQLVASFARKRDAQRLVTFVQSGGSRLDLLTEHHAVAVAEIHPDATPQQLRDWLRAPTWVSLYLTSDASETAAKHWRSLTDAVCEAKRKANEREWAEYETHQRAQEAQPALDAIARVEAERARAETAATLVESLRVPQARNAIADSVQRGEVRVVNASAMVHETDIAWSDWTERTTWQAWARPAAERIGPNTAPAWDKHTATPEQVVERIEPITRLWTSACADQSLPDVLDLRGAPTGPMRVDLHPHWVEALAANLRRSDRGVVLIVDNHVTAWALARMLS